MFWFRLIGNMFTVFLFFLCFSYSNAEYITYTIRKGDTFFSLSKKFNVDIWLIQKENSITSLRVGEKIKIPVRSYQAYTVKKGDTLFSLSKKFGTTIEEIISANRLLNLDLKVGQNLVIPSSKKLAAVDDTWDKKNGIYVVRKGDTIYSISKKTGVSVEIIRRLNNMKDDKIKIGEILVLDAKKSKVEDTKSKLDFNSIKFELPVSFVREVRRNGRFVELVLSKEDKIRVVNNGEVVFIGTFSIFGNTVIVKHKDNLYTIYGMLNKILVKVGDKVEKGCVIGSPSMREPGVYSVKFSFIINDKMTIPSSI